MFLKQSQGELRLYKFHVFSVALCWPAGSPYVLYIRVSIPAASYVFSVIVSHDGWLQLMPLWQTREQLVTKISAVVTVMLSLYETVARRWLKKRRNWLLNINFERFCAPICITTNIIFYSRQVHSRISVCVRVKVSEFVSFLSRGLMLTTLLSTEQLGSYMLCAGGSVNKATCGLSSGMYRISVQCLHVHFFLPVFVFHVGPYSSQKGEATGEPSRSLYHIQYIQSSRVWLAIKVSDTCVTSHKSVT